MKKTDKQHQNPVAKNEFVRGTEDEFAGLKENPFRKIEGMKPFASRWNYDLAIVKYAKEKGCPGFLPGNRIDPEIAMPFINGILRDQKRGKTKLSESEARTIKIEAETRKLDREEALENKIIQSENFIDQKIRHEILMPERDRLQGLQKKYHRFKAIQPDIAQKIMEVDLPELLERLRMKTEKQDERAARHFRRIEKGR